MLKYLYLSGFLWLNTWQLILLKYMRHPLLGMQVLRVLSLPTSRHHLAGFINITFIIHQYYNISSQPLRNLLYIYIFFVIALHLSNGLSPAFKRFEKYIPSFVSDLGKVTLLPSYKDSIDFRPFLNSRIFILEKLSCLVYRVSIYKWILCLCRIKKLQCMTKQKKKKKKRRCFQ